MSAAIVALPFAHRGGGCRWDETLRLACRCTFATALDATSCLPMQCVAAAVHHLKRADSVLARVMARVGPCLLAVECERNEFGALVEAILYQQLALKAAQTISSRFQQLYASDGSGHLPHRRNCCKRPVTSSALPAFRDRRSVICAIWQKRRDRGVPTALSAHGISGRCAARKTDASGTSRAFTRRRSGAAVILGKIFLPGWRHGIGKRGRHCVPR